MHKKLGVTGVSCSRDTPGAVVPRLQKLMEEAMKAEVPIPSATILEEDDRAVSAQLYWMLLMVYLQGCSSEYRVPGRRQRRSRGLATVDGEVQRCEHGS